MRSRLLDHLKFTDQNYSDAAIDFLREGEVYLALRSLIEASGITRPPIKTIEEAARLLSVV